MPRIFLRAKLAGANASNIIDMTQLIRPEDLTILKQLAAIELGDTLQRRVEILILYESGLKTAEIAEKVDLSPGRVLYWRREYLKKGLEVVADALHLLEDQSGEKNGSSAEDAEALPPDKVKPGAKKERKKAKKARKKSKAAAKTPKGSLKRLTQAAKKAGKGKGKKGNLTLALGALDVSIKQAESRSKSLEKKLSGLRKNKADRLEKKIKRLRKQIQRARKVVDRLRD